MTPHDLIGSIFARAQDGVAPDVRRITSDQLKYLRDLIVRDAEAGKLRRDGAHREAWDCAGKWRYAIEETPGGKLHRLTRARRIEAPATLFDL
ncbi:MAG TPA: hypothetical protein VGR47_06040 [Terracidiphilus sp.]|nr:hypothetical protein [Terracidiphilus sp.]